MNFYTFLQDGQHPKVVEKILSKIADMLVDGEHIEYIAVQKKPVVTLWPDSITVSDKRIFLCEFTKFGRTTHFEIFRWHDIENMDFREGLFGARLTLIPIVGENLIIGCIPKVQARRLHQIIKDALEKPEAPRFEPKPKESLFLKIPPSPEEGGMRPPKNSISEGKQEEQTPHLEKLKQRYHRQLITRAEYESKKSEMLSQK